MAKKHVGTQEVRIDLSATVPRIYIDGRQRGARVDITYQPPPAEGLTVKRVLVELAGEDQ